MRPSAIVSKYNKLREKGKITGAADHKINSLNNQATADTSKIALNAAAIQDHLMRRMFGNREAQRIQKPKTRSLAQAGKDIVSILTNPKATCIENIELEKKKQEYLNSLTLAEKLHLVKKPKPPLTTQQWKGIELQHEKRFTIADSCPICQEAFGIKEQVILSCSHVYHKTCLESFEKYCNAKVCPVCRKEQYDKKAYNEGLKLYAMNALIKIQAATRGYLAKKNFYQHMIDIKYKPKSKALGKRLFGHKLAKFANRAVAVARKQQKDVDRFIEKIDKQLEANEFLFTNLRIDEALVEKAKRLKEEKEEAKVDWNKVEEKAKLLGQKDCPICLASLVKDNKQKYLVSCGHIFHKNCLDSFERFDLGESKKCPMCRSHYCKKLIQHNI